MSGPEVNNTTGIAVSAPSGQPASGSLRRQILFSHLQLAGIGILSLCAVFFVSIWQRNNVRTLVLEKGPAVAAALKVRSGIQRSVSDLQGWVALNDAEFRKRRRKVWAERVEPAIVLLKTLSRSWDDPDRVAVFSQGQELAHALKISQWWVEDVAHTPGNNPVQITYRTLLEPMENSLSMSLKVLVDEQEPRMLRGVDPQLYLAMIKFREELAACADALDETLVNIHLAYPGQVFRQHFRNVEEQSAVIRARSRRLNRVQRESLENILHELSAYEKYAEKLFALRRDGPQDIARQRMTSETVPLATRTMALFDALSDDLALQMRREENRLRQISNAFAGFLALGILVVAALALVISRRQAGRLVQPLADLTRVSTQLAEGRLSELLPVNSADELGQLTRSFNAMAVQIQKRTVQLDARVREAEKLNAEMMEVMADLRISNQELEAFTSTVSHDLRAPLRHISGFVAVLQDREGVQLDNRARNDLAKISGAAEKLGKMIDDLLAFSRAGRTEVTMKSVNMNQLFAEVRAEIDEIYPVPAIRWQLGVLPEVKADAGTLRQVVVNLLDNAAKYSRKTAVPQIEISAQRGAGEIIFEIRDNGVGFDPVYTDKLFNVFQRLHRDDEFSGTGIGLASVQRIILRHGGWVKAESQPGQGACFRFALPYKAEVPNDSAEL